MAYPENIHKVPQKMWNRWNVTQRVVFTETYESILRTGTAGIMPPDYRDMPSEKFEVVAWNVAVIAAFDVGKKL
jgi:hypothetical protein